MNEGQQLQLIKAIAAIASGVVLIGFAYSILVRMIMFCVGCGLVFYGLDNLNIASIKSVLGKIKNTLRSLFS